MIRRPSVDLQRAVLEYNRYRSPEAVAKITYVSGDGFEVEFKGAFCQSCGVQDYFEDLIYELERLAKVTAEVSDITRVDEDTYRVRFSEVRRTRSDLDTSQSSAQRN